ncbi:PREDICTED: A disintegrin and metalloproteinase with thrombospondin motifs 6-like [Nicrophorus vespilloides]|uniref:A disintegrin and metalloproteinase with thrombospondin motifs 6-like n=1 Tax=Nicrophorus vespilloides TaxID=110193 RepID=A0ABM1MCK2_NICVS|nr:PREDICTED: A disintegrin and metalloproteinase with thrombospondin motifs 6-like [Nicrophorus vespilloides]
MLAKLVLFSAISWVCSFSINDLHEYMTDSELNHYFSESKKIGNYEVVYLPTVVSVREATTLDGEDVEFGQFDFSAFGKPINLKLTKNTNLISPHFKSYIHEDDYIEELKKPVENCNFIHKDENGVGSINICVPKRVQGLLFLNNITLEILPLTKRLEAILKIREPLIEGEDFEDKIPHLVKRATDKVFHYDSFPVKFINSKQRIQRASNRPVGGLTVELGLFFDEAAYKIFAPYMNYDDSKLQDMILAYVNAVQALYHHPSLGTSINLLLVRLDIMKKQPSKMPHYDGERGKLLDSFCDYQNKINPPDDNHPEHWDMGLYVSGLDFFAYEKGRKSGVTMGLATVGGVCLGQYACVIAEMGTTNVFGKPYPSAGFTSVYILAHEIGHNLGMHHDGTGNSCPKEGYVMSPSRGTNGETQWSSCSAEIVSKLSWATCLQDSGKPPNPALDHTKFMDIPGQIYTIKKQCEILLRDKDAYMSSSQQLSTICYNLQCKTPHRSGYYHAGPALEGTQCGKGKYCYGGDCVAKTPPKPVDTVPGGWGPWKTGSCTSGCILKSQGYQDKRRICNSPYPLNTDKGCEGSSYEIGLCKDDKLCSKKKRRTASEYASKKCGDFSKLLPQLDPKGSGLQAPHEEARLWMGCAIFCRRADSGSYYTPRIELNDLGVSPYFPDGTWCHSDNGGNYYCVQHHCLPENFQFTKSFFNGLGDDIPIPQNAHPSDLISGSLLKYLSLGPDGKPLQTTLRPGDTDMPKDEDWETNDYLLLPHINEIPESVVDSGEVDNFLDFME